MADLVTLQFESTGLLTTIQDAGREGHRDQGVPVGGFMDHQAAHLANSLVGNDPGSPLFEITISGPRIRFKGAACHIAITGALMNPMINGAPAENDVRHTFTDGDILSFGRLEWGCRAYLAIGGDLACEKWLDSASAFLAHPTLMRSSRIVRRQVISIRPSKPGKLPDNIKPFSRMSPGRIRVTPGPEYDWFNEKTRSVFDQQSFTISNQSSRMGIRLEEVLTEVTLNKGLISSGVIPGTIQVTQGGKCMILMNDAQTSGGYPRFVNVISDDMDTLAQFKPGDNIRFELVNR